MKKISTVQTFKSEIFKEQKLTIGLDLGDRWSFYCVKDEASQVILEQKLPTTPEAMKQTFGKIPRSLIALETGTHSHWVSRLLTEQADHSGAAGTHRFPALALTRRTHSVPLPNCATK